MIVSSPKILRRVLAGGVLSAVLTLSSYAHKSGTVPTAAVAPAVTLPANGYPDPAAACLNGGGKYLGDMKCQMASGAIAPILSGVELQRAMASRNPVTPESPHAWALATTAMIFEMNGHRHDLLSGTAATPDGQETGKRLLSQAWGVNNRDDLVRMLTWLQFQGHRVEFEQL